MYGENLRTYDSVPREVVRRGNYTDTADMGEDYLCSICYSVGADELVYVTDVVYSPEPMEVTEGLVAGMLRRAETRKAWIESNNGGRGFARAVQILVPEVNVVWFHQSENKEARVLSNSSAVMHMLRMPTDWASKWPVFHHHVTTYRRLFRANRLHDAADVLTGIVEKEKRDPVHKTVKAMMFRA